MEDINNGENKGAKILFIVIGFLLFFSVILILFILFQKKKEVDLSENKAIKTESEVEQVITPSISPSPTYSGNNYRIFFSQPSLNASVGKEIRVPVIFDTDGKRISGFDIVFIYNPDYLEFLRVENKNDNFKVQTFKQTGKIILTGYVLPDKDSVSFEGYTALEILFKSKAKGNSKIVIEPFIGKDKTQFVSETSEVIIPQVGMMEIIIE